MHTGEGSASPSSPVSSPVRRGASVPCALSALCTRSESKVEKAPRMKIAFDGAETVPVITSCVPEELIWCNSPVVGGLKLALHTSLQSIYFCHPVNYRNRVGRRGRNGTLTESLSRSFPPRAKSSEGRSRVAWDCGDGGRLEAPSQTMTWSRSRLPSSLAVPI